MAGFSNKAALLQVSVSRRDVGNPVPLLIKRTVQKRIQNLGRQKNSAACCGAPRTTTTRVDDYTKDAHGLLLYGKSWRTSSNTMGGAEDTLQDGGRFTCEGAPPGSHRRVRTLPNESLHPTRHQESAIGAAAMRSASKRANGMTIIEHPSGESSCRNGVIR